MFNVQTLAKIVPFMQPMRTEGSFGNMHLLICTYGGVASGWRVSDNMHLPAVIEAKPNNAAGN